MEEERFAEDWKVSSDVYLKWLRDAGEEREVEILVNFSVSLSSYVSSHVARYLSVVSALAASSDLLS